MAPKFKYIKGLADLMGEVSFGWRRWGGGGRCRAYGI